MKTTTSISQILIVAATGGLMAMNCGGPEPGDDPEPGNGPPDEPVSNGSQQVVLEIDRMTGTQAVQDEQVLGGDAVSLTEIYEAGDVNLRIVHDQDDLERAESIRLADLHALMTANRTVDAGEDEWHVHMLVVTEDADDPGTLGIMFDFGSVDNNDIPREAFAVFESAHEGLSGGLVPEVLLTSAHELAHAFNLHHTDWEGTGFQNDATIESYSMTDTVRWSLSPQSVAHLTEHDERLVKPGSGGLAFASVTQEHLDDHKSIPRESYNVIDVARGSVSRSAGTGVVKGYVVRSQLPKQVSQIARGGPVELVVEVPQNTYTVGEPVIASVALRNTGDEAVSVIPQLQPEYRFLSISIKPPGSDDFVPYHPPVLRDARRVGSTTLEAGDRLEAEARLFLSTDGWTFEKPGKYVIQASYPAGTIVGNARIESEPLTIEIKSPASETTTTAKRLLLDESTQQLGREQGLFLYMEGGDHLKYGADRLRQLVDEAPDAAQASAARLALGNAALNPTFDPTRRVRPDANLDEAMKYLEGLSDAKNLPAQSIRRVGDQLTYELEKVDRVDDATMFRRDMVEKLERTRLDDGN